MTEKEKFANRNNFSKFTKENPKLAFLILLILIPIFPIISTVERIYTVLSEERIFSEVLSDWKRFIKAVPQLYKYINFKG